MSRQAAKQWHRAWGGVLAFAVLTAGCDTPLATGTVWLVGSWRWTGSVSGMGEVTHPDSPNALVVTLHEDGSALVEQYGLVLLRTSFETHRSRLTQSRIRLTFRDPVPEVEGKTYVAPESDEPVTLVNGFTLHNGAAGCDDCVEWSTFVRVP